MVALITTKLPALGNAPDPDRPAEFDDEADEMMRKLPPLQQAIDAFGGEANALANDVNSLAQAAATSAAQAAQGAVAAGAALWVSGQSYAIPAAVVDPVTLFLYRKRTGASSSTTPPRSDPTNWKNISVIPPAVGSLGSVNGILNWDLSAMQIAHLNASGSYTVAAPTNMAPGTYVLHAKNLAAGGLQLVFDPVFCFIEDVPPQIDPGPNRRTILSFICDGATMFGSYLPGFTK
ncbi:hypothetical protein IFT43_14920 [Oxalobacteraceae sp. CFBP 13708]|nr:hypothetical protein [Oxalobacteraceae sp. CFBP 13708]